MSRKHSTKREEIGWKTKLETSGGEIWRGWRGNRIWTEAEERCETVVLNKQSILRAYRPEERGDRIKEAKGLKGWKKNEKSNPKHEMLRVQNKKKQRIVGDRQSSVTGPEQKSLYPAAGGAAEEAPQGSLYWRKDKLLIKYGSSALVWKYL